jgi:hypothetical protein
MFRELIAAYAQTGSRRISEVHLHHTWRPTRRQYHDLAASIGPQEAGLLLVQSMWRHHVKERGFANIAQQLTIDPVGGLWLGRPWNERPASAVGFNGSLKRGPFMIEVIGDFDLYAERFDGEQRAAAINVIRAINAACHLPSSALTFHNEMAAKSCPGSSVDKRALIAEIEAAETPQNLARATGPLASDQIDTAAGSGAAQRERVKLAMYLTKVSPETPRDVDEGELPEGELGDPSGRYLDGEMEANLSRTRAGKQPPITPLMLITLRDHVINLEQGRFSDTGLLTSSAERVEEIFRSAIPRVTRDWPTLKLVFYAHGGLVDEEQAIRQAHEHREWWLANGIYPIFFIWETGPLEVALQTIKEKASRGHPDARAFITDELWERAARLIGRPLWRGMLASAARASEDGGGATIVVNELARLKQVRPGVEIHLVGHSAGTIFHTHFARRLSTAAVPISSVQLLAPAVSVALYKQELMQLVDGQRVKKLRVFNMREALERNDPTMRHYGYGKSILYAVHGAFEDRAEVPILGLEESLFSDRDLLRHFGVTEAGQAPANLVWSTTGPEAPERYRSNSTTHGFDQDADTMTATLLEVLDRQNSQGLKPFPGRTSGVVSEGARFAAIDELLDDTGGSGGAAALKPAPAAVPDKFGPTTVYKTRRALCIGINYADDPNFKVRLTGCLNDAKAWAEMLRGLGYVADPLLLEVEATFEGIRAKIKNFVSSANAGDDLIIQYAGHGTDFTDYNGDEPTDLDQAIVPYDYKMAGCLLDDELREMFASLPAGARLTTIFDCCHSGSATRIIKALDLARVFDGGRPALRPRFLEPDLQLAGLTKEKWRRPARSLEFTQEQMRNVHFAACRDDQLAYELDGQGRFTKIATQIFARGVGLSFRELHARIESEFAAFDNQDPILEGPASMKDARF